MTRNNVQSNRHSAKRPFQPHLMTWGSSQGFKSCELRRFLIKIERTSTEKPTINNFSQAKVLNIYDA